MVLHVCQVDKLNIYTKYEYIDLICAFQEELTSSAYLARSLLLKGKCFGIS